MVLRELLDKKFCNMPDRIKEKDQFDKTSISPSCNTPPEYWQARQKRLEQKARRREGRDGL